VSPRPESPDRRSRRSPSTTAWAHLRGGAFVVKDQERQVKPFAQDPVREARLWDATAGLLNTARN